MYEKRDVTYSADTGQRFTLVSHAHERCVINNMASVYYSNSHDETWPFFHFHVITFDQNWHNLYSPSARGKHLSNDAQIRVISRMEPEICTKMLKKLSEKLRPKFPATTPGCSMVKIACLDDAFLEIFICKQAQYKVSHCSKKKRKKREGEKKIQTSKSLKTLVKISKF